MTDTAIGPYVMGEKPPPLEYTYLDCNGVRIDLTGYSVLLRVQRTDSTSYLELSALLSDGPNGVVAHAWTGSEFLTPGPHWLEFWAGNGVNRYASTRLRAEVRTPVGPVPSV